MKNVREDIREQNRNKMYLDILNSLPLVNVGYNMREKVRIYVVNGLFLIFTKYG